MRYGFFDAARMNAYVGCLADGNGAKGIPGLVRLGAEYHTEGETNTSTFVGCYAEGRSTDEGTCEFYGQVNCIGGTLGNSNIRQDSSAFILEHGVASRAPLVYKNLAGAKSIGCSLGTMSQTVQGPGTEMIAFQWATLEDQNLDFTSLRYLDEPDVPPETRGHGWWALEHNNSLYRHMIRFPTTRANARSPAPWFVNGIYLGRDDIGPPKVSFTAAPRLPNTQDNLDPLTYEKGDVVWSSEPSPGRPIGQVCIDSGTQSLSLGIQTADPVKIGDTTVKLNRVDVWLAPGQYITIGDGEDAYTIMKVTPTNSTVDITPGALIGVSVGAAIAFTIPTAAPVNVGDIQVQLNNVEALVPGQYIKIGNGTDTYKIVKVTLATIDITPGALIGVSVGAAIAIAGGTPVGVRTSKTVNEGDTTVTLNKVDGLMSGQSVTIGGGTNVYTIVKVSLPTIDIASINSPPGAHAVVPVGKAIAFSPATFSTFGEVVNIGNSTSYAVDTLLARADRYVTVTATGRIMTLPASPVDGQTHSIKSQAGVTTKVDTEGGVLTIDGQNSVTLASGDNGTFRYSAATGEWELR